LGSFIKEKTEEEQESMTSKTELKMRKLYFDLGRDDFMAMDEYLQSGQAKKDLKEAGFKKGGYVKSSAQTSVIPGARAKGSAEGSTIPGAKAKGSAEGSVIPMKMKHGGDPKKGSMLSITIEEKPIDKKTMNMIKKAEKTGNVLKMKSGGAAKRGYGKARR